MHKDTEMLIIRCRLISIYLLYRFARTTMTLLAIEYLEDIILGIEFRFSLTAFKLHQKYTIVSVD